MSNISGFPRRTPIQSLRFLIGFWWTFCVAIIATYTGNLIAFLAVEKEIVPFQTYRDLAENQEYKVGTLGGTYSVTFLRVRLILQWQQFHLKNIL